MSAAPRISVVLPARNAMTYLDEAVRSILDQTFRDFELLLIDDGSTDGTGARCEEFAAEDPRVRVIHTPGLGVAGALNLGLSEARAPLIARMDADDVATPERFDKCVRFLDDHPEIGALSGWMRYIDAKGKPGAFIKPELKHEDIERNMLAGRNQMLHPAMMMRREIVERAGRYNPDRCPSEDFDLWLRMLDITRMANLPEVLVNYRLHGLNISMVSYKKGRSAAQAALDEALNRRGLAHLKIRLRGFPERLVRARRHRYQGRMIRFIATCLLGVFDPEFLRYLLRRARRLVFGRTLP